MEKEIQQFLSAIRSLPPKERKILFFRHGLDSGITRTLEEVGREFGVTRERIRQIEAKTFEMIRQKLKELSTPTVADEHKRE